MRTLLLTILIFGSAYFASSQRFVMSDPISIGGPQWDIATGISVTPEGKIVLSGSYYGHIYLGPDTLVSNGSRDGFLALYNPDGSYLKSVSLGGAGHDYLTNLKANGNGIMAAQRFNRKTQHGMGEVRGLSRENCLALFWDHDLNMKSSILLGSTMPIEILDVDTDTGQDAGYKISFLDSLFIGGESYSSETGHGLYNGTFNSADRKGSLMDTGVNAGGRLFAMNTTDAGIRISAGITPIHKNDEINPLPIVKEGMNHLFLIVSEEAAKREMVEHPIEGIDFEPVCMLVDSSSIWILINFSHAIIHNGTELASRGKSDILLLRRDLKGKNFDYCQIGGEGDEKAAGMTITENGVVMTGKFTGNLSIADQEILAPWLGSGIFIVGINESCKPLAVNSVNVEGSGFPCGIASHGDQIYIAGQYRGILRAGNSEIESRGDDDIFILKFEDCQGKGPVSISQSIIAGNTLPNQWELDAGQGFESYKWEDNKSSSRYLIVDIPGTYRVVVTDIAGCTRQGEITLADTKSAANDQEIDGDLSYRIFPSITDGMVFWEPATSWEGKKLRIRVLDTTGRLIYAAEHDKVNRQVYHFDLGNQPQGSCFVEFTGDGFREIAKILVNK